MSIKVADVKWPVEASDKENVVSIQTEDDCFPLLIVAHFCYEDAKKLRNISQQARFHENKIGKYFTFPKYI